MSSFNFDIGALLNSVVQVFNGFAPLLFPIAGVSLGIALLFKIVNEIRNAF
jgi:hypothetical protein